MDKINPIILTDEDTGEKFTLEFSRATVKFAESKGFVLGEVGDFPLSRLPDLFFYAFRMHHQNVARSRTDTILEDMGGLSKEVIERLGQLYMATLQSIIRIDEDEQPKNLKVTVEL